MMKTHRLTKLQLLLAILCMIPSCLLIYVNESEQHILFFTSIIPWIGFSIITIYLGWLIAIRKEVVIYPHESFAIRFAKKTRGQEAANKLMSTHTKSKGKNWIGYGNLFSGIGCLIIAIVGIVIMIRDLL